MRNIALIDDFKVLLRIVSATNGRMECHQGISSVSSPVVANIYMEI